MSRVGFLARGRTQVELRIMRAERESLGAVDCMAADVLTIMSLEHLRDAEVMASVGGASVSDEGWKTTF